MPCQSDEVMVGPDTEVVDLLELHGFRPARKFLPRNKAELVGAVAMSTAQHHSLRALGANWSLSHAGIATDLVDTADLKKHLSQPRRAGSTPLASHRLRDGGQDLLARLVPEGGASHYVHVEAGIKIKDLLDDLKSCGLALPTMGAGGGQSLAGALSTGTHGADIDTPPLVEWVRAVHLVGPGGQEWWVTPQESAFASDELFTLSNWCEDTRIVAHDEAFDAVRTAVGRIGVIYSMILEVVPAYVLIEANLAHEWRQVRKELGTSSIVGGKRTGIFDAPLTGIADGWFRENVIDTYILVKHTGGKGFNPTAVKVAERGLVPEKLKFMGLVELARDLHGATPKQLRHANIVVNLSRPEQCWMTRRWAVAAWVGENHMEPTSRRPIVQALIENKRDPRRIVAPLREVFTAGWDGDDWINLAVGLAAHIDVAKEFVKFVDVRMPLIAAECTTSGEALFLILYRLLTNPVLAETVRQPVLDAVSGVLSGDFTKRVRVGHACDVLDTHDYDFDGAQSGDSAEFLFDAAAQDYLHFADAVVALARDNYPLLGYMGIRFTPRASALIAMQRFDLTASVEVATGRARQDNVYAAFWDKLHEAAEAHHGIPHWGQEFRQSRHGIEEHYGSTLVRWRSMLAELSTDGPAAFSTTFSRAVGLEPTEASGLFLEDALTMFLRALDGATD